MTEAFLKSSLLQANSEKFFFAFSEFFLLILLRGVVTPPLIFIITLQDYEELSALVLPVCTLVEGGVASPELYIIALH